MNNIRWANEDQTGIVFDDGDRVVYLDGGALFDEIKAGGHGAIGDPIVIETPPEVGAIRSLRNKMLAESDWTQLSDASADATAWAIYRQELRDIPLQEGFPADITWPTKP